VHTLERHDRRGLEVRALREVIAQGVSTGEISTRAKARRSSTVDRASVVIAPRYVGLAAGDLDRGWNARRQWTHLERSFGRAAIEARIGLLHPFCVECASVVGVVVAFVRARVIAKLG